MKERLRTYEGVPAPFDKKKRYVMPTALRIKCLAPGRKWAVLGRLSHDVLVLPSDLVGQSSKDSPLTAGRQTFDPKSRRHDVSLLLVIGGGDTLVGTKTLLHGGCTAIGLVGDHTTNSTPENLGGGAEMVWT